MSKRRSERRSGIGGGERHRRTASANGIGERHRRTASAPEASEFGSLFEMHSRARAWQPAVIVLLAGVVSLAFAFRAYIRAGTHTAYHELDLWMTLWPALTAVLTVVSLKRAPGTADVGRHAGSLFLFVALCAYAVGPWDRHFPIRSWPRFASFLMPFVLPIAAAIFAQVVGVLSTKRVRHLALFLAASWIFGGAAIVRAGTRTALEEVPPSVVWDYPNVVGERREGDLRLVFGVGNGVTLCVRDVCSPAVAGVWSSPWGGIRGRGGRVLVRALPGAWVVTGNPEYAHGKIESHAVFRAKDLQPIPVWLARIGLPSFEWAGRLAAAGAVLSLALLVGPLREAFAQRWVWRAVLGEYAGDGVVVVGDERATVSADIPVGEVTVRVTRDGRTPYRSAMQIVEVLAGAPAVIRDAWINRVAYGVVVASLGGLLLAAPALAAALMGYCVEW